MSSADDLRAVVVDNVLFGRETRDGSRRCYRGGICDLERVSRDDDYWLSGLGHLIGVNRPGEAFAVTVWSPARDELLAGEYGEYDTIRARRPRAAGCMSLPQPEAPPPWHTTSPPANRSTTPNTASTVSSPTQNHPHEPAPTRSILKSRTI